MANTLGARGGEREVFEKIMDMRDLGLFMSAKE